MKNIRKLAGLMSPYDNLATLAVANGDISTPALDSARQEVARFADRVIGRGRTFAHSPGRTRLIIDARAVYDDLACMLSARGEL